MLRMILLVLLLPGGALAGPDRLSLLLGSHHVNATETFEEVNPGLFLDWVRPDGLTLTAGVYRNSYGRTSVAAMVGREVWRSGAAGLEVFGGLAHYPVDGPKSPVAVGDVVPLAGLRFQHRDIVIIALPGDGAATDLVLGFGLTLPLH